MPFCQHCGGEIQFGWKACPHCANPIVNTPQPTAPQPATPQMPQTDSTSDILDFIDELLGPPPNIPTTPKITSTESTPDILDFRDELLGPTSSIPTTPKITPTWSIPHIIDSIDELPETTPSIQYSVVGGDLSLTQQVHHPHNRKIVQNQIINESIHPMDDFSEAVTSAYESGKKALISIGVLFLIALIWYSIWYYFAPSETYFEAGGAVLACLWVANGIFIFMQAGPINTFSRLREQYPASPSLKRGDNGKVMHDLAKYIWVLPLVILVIVAIIAYFILKISAEMNKHQNR